MECTLAQITNTSFDSNIEPSINAAGTRIAFVSDGDTASTLTAGKLSPCLNCPGNPDGNREIFLYDTTFVNADGTLGAFTQITDTTIEFSNEEPAISADGTRIAFVSSADFTGDNRDIGEPFPNREIFLYDTTTVNPDGTFGAFTQITNTTGSTGNEDPAINADGTRIAFRSRAKNLTDANLDGNREIFLNDTGTMSFTQITNTTGGINREPAINADGTRVALVSNRDLTGGNLDLSSEIFLFNTTTVNPDGTLGAFTQITNTPAGSNNAQPAINADGTRIAFVSDRDTAPTLTPGKLSPCLNCPGNAVFNQEIFIYDTTSGEFMQLTDTIPPFVNGQPSINAAGTRIAFISDADLTPKTPNNPGNADDSLEIFLYDTATSTFTQITDTDADGFNLDPSINAAGTRIAFDSDSDLTGQNDDRNDEIFLARCPQPPIADAGPDQTVECSGPSGATVTLDGSDSTDPDGDMLTYTWTEGTMTLATTADPMKTATVALGLGTRTIQLTVNDGNGGADSDEVIVTVQDTTAPAIEALTPSPTTLWPPDHRLVPVTVAVSVSDICDATPTCQIISVSSNGAVNTSPDWEITDSLTVNLRAARSGSGGERVYSVEVQCTDASGNSSTMAVDVTVPHDQRKN